MALSDIRDAPASSANRPVQTIAPGDTLEIHTIDSSGGQLSPRSISRRSTR